MRSPFFGVYYNQAGELVDMFTGEIMNAADLVPRMTPFYGVFLDAQGNPHDLSELGSGGGAAATAAQVSVAQIQGLAASSVQQALSEIMTAQITPLWQAENNLEAKFNAATAVSPVRSSAIHEGLQLHCVNVGSVYSYFTGEIIIENEIVIAPSDQLLLADTSDFPELDLYQGVGLVETAHALTVDIENGTITHASILVIVAQQIGIINFSTTTPLTIPANTLFTFNKLLVLGEPTTPAEGILQAQQNVKPAQQKSIQEFLGLKPLITT